MWCYSKIVTRLEWSKEKVVKVVANAISVTRWIWTVRVGGSSRFRCCVLWNQAGKRRSFWFWWWRYILWWMGGWKGSWAWCLYRAQGPRGVLRIVALWIWSFWSLHLAEVSYISEIYVKYMFKKSSVKNLWR